MAEAVKAHRSSTTAKTPKSLPAVGYLVLELGIDFLVSGGNALCPGTVNQLTSHLDPTLYTFTWFEGGIVIPNETGPNLLINHTGTYSLTAQLINTTCSATDTITVEYYDPIVLPTPNNMTRCNASGYAQFNLPQMILLFFDD